MEKWLVSGMKVIWVDCGLVVRGVCSWVDWGEGGEVGRREEKEEEMRGEKGR